MKKLIFPFLALFLLAGTTFAQDASSAYKAGMKAYKNWQTETNNDKKAELLNKAASNIDIATAGSTAFEGKSLTKMWILAGQVYNEVANTQVIASTVNPEATMERPDAAMKAYSALTSAIKVANKKYFKSDAFELLKSTSSHLSNTGLLQFKNKDYEAAFKNYAMVTELNDMLDSSGKKKVLDNEDKMNDHVYMYSLSAMSAGKMDEAEAGFNQLKGKDYEGSGVYNALIQINMDKGDNEKAEALLTEARQKYPEDNSLMVTELNHYLTNNRFDELVGKLEAAIAADPENVSYYSALGNTYDNLFQREMEAKNLEKADQYFSKAMDYYNQALEKDDKYFFAIYNIGVLYVNKANLLIEELKVMEDKGDYSKSALAAMESKKTTINEEFEKSLPYFQRAEKINPNDMNTLNALKEIYARKENFEVSKVFGERIRTLESGGQHDSSYFEGK